MKIAYLKVGLFPLHTFTRPGGVKNHVLALHSEFEKRGLQSKIVVPRREARENYGQNIMLFGTSFPFDFNGTKSDLTVCFIPGAISGLLKKEKFDILHFHNFGFHSAQILEKSKAINILTFHACISPKTTEFFKTYPFILDAFKRKVKEKFHGIIGVAPFNLDLFKDFKGPKVVIPNGIDLEKFNPNSPKIEKYLDGKINILFVGRLEERKGLIYLLKAYGILQKKFDSLRLIIVGKGNLESEHRKWAKDHKLENVIFEGEVTGDKIIPFYATCDIFCSPAIFGESFGIVLLEAMAMGKPVVAFGNRGYKTVLINKGKDFLAKPKDWPGLAQKLEILIQDKEKREKMGEWGRKESQKYAWPNIADRVLNFYQAVLESRK